MKKESTTWLKAGWLHALQCCLYNVSGHFSYRPTFIRFSPFLWIVTSVSWLGLTGFRPSVVSCCCGSRVSGSGCCAFSDALQCEFKHGGKDLCNNLMMHSLSDHLNLVLFSTLSSSARVNIHSQHLRQKWQKVISHSCSLLAYWSQSAVIDEVDPKLTQYERPTAASLYLYLHVDSEQSV